MKSGSTGPVALAAGIVWTLALLWIGARVVSLPVFTLMPTIMTAFLAPGRVAALIAARVALCRGAGGADANAPAPIDGHVLSDTVVQLVLALCIWPAAAVLLGAAGPGMIVTLGAGFAVARLLCWIGAHRSPALEGFATLATIGPTLAVALWALVAAAALTAG